MNNLKPVFQSVYGLVALLLVLAALLVSTPTRVEFNDFQLAHESGRHEPVTMPLLRPTWALGTYKLSGTIDIGWLSPRTFHIVPDDKLLAIRINDMKVDLAGFPSERLQDVRNGFKVNLGGYLHSGTNRIVVDFYDYGGDMGMSLAPAMTDQRQLTYILVCVLLGGVVLIGFAQRWQVPKRHGFLYYMIVLASMVQVWYIHTYNPTAHIWSDPARHWEQGLDILRADLMAVTDPIGYQLFVAVLGKLSLGNAALITYFTSILALLGPWFWYRFFRELQSNKTLALLGWAILMWLPSWTAIYGYFMQETLMLPLLGAALWATWRCRRKGDARNFIFMVALWVAVGLTRGIAIPMAAVACTCLWLTQDQKIKKAVYSSIVLLLIMGPLTYRSFVTVNHFAPHGMGHLNIIYAQSGKKTIEITSSRGGSRWMHGFGSPSTGMQPLAPFSDWSTRREGTVEVTVDFDEGTRDWDLAKDKIDLSWSDYSWILKENIIFLFIAESWPDSNKSRLVDQVNSIMRWIWAPMLVFIFVTMAVNHRRLRRQWLLPGMIIAWFVVQGLIPISVNEGRYRKPFEGLAVAYLVLWLGAGQGRARPAGPGNSIVADMRALRRRSEFRNEQPVEAGKDGG